MVAEEHAGALLTVKYVDPTIRAVAANAADNLYCTLLAHSAIHGAMAGYTRALLAFITRLCALSK